MYFNFEHKNVLVYGGIGNVDCPCDLNIHNIYEEDLNNNFLVEHLNYTQCDLMEELTNCINYFKSTFGIDFSQKLQCEDKILNIFGARLSPFVLSESLNTELISEDKARVHDGGWILEIEEPGYIGVHNNQGSYFQPGTFFIWGFQKLIYQDNSQKVFHYHSVEPCLIFKTNFNSVINTNYIIYTLQNSFGRSETCVGNYNLSISLAKKNNLCLIQLRAIIDFAI